MRITRKVYFGVASLLVAAGALVAMLNVTGTPAEAITMGSRRDCGYTDVIINCGAISTDELLQKYDSNNDGRGNRDIQAIYHHYGIERSDITGATSVVKRGWLNTNGVISVDGKTVATNAKSLYRVNPGHPVSPVSINGKTYYIGPVSGSYSLGADVYVFFKNGVFHAAIQSSCGNPIVATPEKPPVQPVYSCDSLKAVKVDRTKFNFTSSATAKNGAEIVNYTYNFGDSHTQTTGASTSHTYEKPGTYTVTVTVNVKVNGVIKSVTSTNCKVTVKVEEVPVTPTYTCDSLKAEKIDRTKFKFTAAATVTGGAQIVSYTYNFGDSHTQTVTGTSVEHTYDKPGTYTTTVSVNVKVNGQTKTVTSTNCKVTVKVENVPVTPTYACDSLKAEKINRTTFKFTSAASAAGGAQIVSYTYDFGDSHTQTVTGTTVNHTYDKPGTYTTKVSVNVKVNGETKSVTSTNCKVTVKVEEVPVTPTYACEDLTAEKINRTTFKFTTDASVAGGAEIVSYTYNFGDSHTQTVTGTSVNHTYDKPGNYTITVSVNVKVNGETKTVTSTDCKTTVKVENVPVTPTYACDDLTIKRVENKENTYAYTLTYTAENGATLKKAVYDFGDSKTVTLAAAQATTTEHTYAQAGTYTTTATLYFDVKNGETTVEKTVECEVSIAISPEMCDVPGKENFPKNSPECKEQPEMCDVPGKENLPKNSPECKEETEFCEVPGKEDQPKNSSECVEIPPELPQTGITGALMGGGLGLSSLTAAGYCWVTSRKTLLNALLNR